MYRCVGLLNLPNCLILQLLSYLDATSLYLLSKTCTRLDEIIKTHKQLWKCIDARRAPNDSVKVAYCSQRSYDHTRTFLIRADCNLETLIDDAFFTKMKTLKNLTVLAVENQTIDSSQFVITNFPSGLHELSLKKTVIVGSGEFLRNSSEHFPQLRVLILDECLWLSSSDFMSISKYKSLEILSVYKCRNIENTIAYLSLSGYGFKSLQVFDARLSSLGNTLLRSLFRSRTLLAVYLQNQDVTYKLDYFKRKLDILQGARTRDFYVDDSEFDMKDTLWAEECGFNYEESEYLDDHGLLGYSSSKAMKNETKLPKSILYLDPYNKCTCGYDKSNKYSSHSPNNGDDSDDSDDQGGGRKITSKIRRLTKIVNKTKGTSTRSRGIVNHNHPRESPAPQIVNLGAFYRSLQNSGDRVCVINVSNLRRPFDNGAHDNDSDENGAGGRSPNRAGYHRNRRKRENSNNNHYQLEVISGKPPSKKPKIDEPEPGPSGLNHADSTDESDCSDYERLAAPLDVAINNFPAEEQLDYRNWDFRNMPVVRIEYHDQLPKNTLVPLRRLSLRGYRKITDVTLNYIKDLDLELLDVTYTSVSEQAIHNYLVDHPTCRVVHENFCVCPTNLHF